MPHRYIAWAYIPPYPHSGRVLYDAARWPTYVPWERMRDVISCDATDYLEVNGANKREAIQEFRALRAIDEEAR